jgi:hypothetical protein
LLHTSPAETREAAGIAGTLALALKTRVVLVRFRLADFDRSRDDLVSDISPCVRQLETAGVGVDVRVYVGRVGPQTIPLAFKSHSLIVIGGHRGSWLSATERHRRMLEPAGHFVVVVDAAESKEPTNA